jgi:signal transduction histidine kinase
MDRQPRGELGILADTFNDMAQRIEQQMLDQRELLAAVSHEIRSPLARIRVLTELLRGAAKSGQLDRLEAEVDGLDQLLSRLLAHSKLDFDALALCEQAPAELARQALVRGNVSADGLEVESQAPSSISLDPTLVARALDNLLENALAHGESPVGLRVGRDAATLGVRFEVFDQGPGFELETLPRVFEAFYRSDPSSGKAQSLGLGLALVQRIAQAHGGTAWAQNLPGGGACVGFSIAARRDSEPKRETR